LVTLPRGFHRASIAVTALTLAGACGRGSALAPDAGTTSSQTIAWPLTAHPKVDLLLMIDGSGSMLTAQANFQANLGSFMDVLKALPGGLPDLHIAVVTSDLGAGDGTSIQGCTLNGEGGVFRFRPTGGCTSVGFTDPNATFIIDSGGANPTTNFGDRDITTVLQCLLITGSSGCGFRHQLGSVARALGADGAPAPAENAGFLRPYALLAIVFLTDDDDCTGPPDSPLFDPTSTTLSSTYGPTEGFLCNEWGHLCVPPGGGAPAQPSRFAPNNLPTDTVTYTPPMATMSNCQSFEQSPVLTAVGTIADGIKALKADPANQIVVSALVGLTEGPDSEGYIVSWQVPPVADVGPWPRINHACGDNLGAGSGFADPAVRIEQFVREFGANGSAYNFCQPNYGNSLTSIATRLAQMTTAPCFSAQVAMKPLTQAPDCAVTEVVSDIPDPSGNFGPAVPFCDSSGTTPCWQLLPGVPGTCPGGSISFSSGSQPIPAGASLTATCALCVPGQPDPSRGCP
jgi:hypothetical protein